MKNPIIPTKSVVYTTQAAAELDLEAICFYMALGFFLGDDTFYKNKKVLLPSCRYSVDDVGNVVPGEPTFEWHYAPRGVSFQTAVDEFAHLFATITREQVEGKEVILPLSGGLDSRSQAVVLHDIGYNRVRSYSYGFADSFDETSFGKSVARQCDFPFDALTVPKNYLWDVLPELASINGCYSEFTHPRQMAVIDRVAAMGNLFFLGHWGDVLFDDMSIDEGAPLEKQIDHLKYKVLKKGGKELAAALWQAWGLPGNFDARLEERIAQMYHAIRIDNVNARIRAFKSMYWAPRWTSVNLNVFASRHPVALPYYDDRMCQFVCTVPEEFLAGRKIQIEYIKSRFPAVAKVPWQTYSPCNLFNYNKYDSWRYKSGRMVKKANRLITKKLTGKRLVERNWENQFLGESNDKHLQEWLFHNKEFAQLVPPELTKRFYDAFKGDREVYYSHPVSMLLTLSVFLKNSDGSNTLIP